MLPADLDRLHRALRAVPALASVTAQDLEPLAGLGIAHDHVRIAGTGLLARVPRVSQLSLAARENLAYQAACFRRLAPSGATPRLHAAIEPDDRLPMGALIVEEIVGRPARVPADLSAIAASLAAIHALPLPPPADRPPLADHRDPAGGTAAVIAAQAVFFEECGLTPSARGALDRERDWAEGFARAAVDRDQ
ncbi:MAG: aminoglycoside phosphotransferase, partial [Alphaproteobacteria bacterium]